MLKLVNISLINSVLLNLTISGYCVHNKFNVTVTANNSGLAIIYYCRLTVSGDNSSIEPTAAICTTNGNWSTNPNKLECGSNTVTMPITSEASTSTRASTFTTSTGSIYYMMGISD